MQVSRDRTLLPRIAIGGDRVGLGDAIVGCFGGSDLFPRLDV